MLWKWLRNLFNRTKWRSYISHQLPSLTCCHEQKINSQLELLNRRLDHHRISTRIGSNLFQKIRKKTTPTIHPKNKRNINKTIIVKTTLTRNEIDCTSAGLSRSSLNNRAMNDPINNTIMFII